MNVKQIIFILLLTTSVYSQAFQAKVFGNFDRNASLVVISNRYNAGITALIEANLLMKGFDVHSEAISSSNKKEISNNIKILKE